MADQKLAAGLLMCRVAENQLNYFLVHPGGPYFMKKDAGVWSIPKGIPEEGETDLLSIAIREFEEETGIKPQEPYFSIGHVQQKAGKIVHAWSFIGAWEASTPLKSNLFSIEWPPKSGKQREFPEVDKGDWFTYEQAIVKINPAQVHFLDRAREIFLKIT